jgi:hypothetical protein
LSKAKNQPEESAKKKRPRVLRWLRSKRFWKRFVILVFLLPVLLFAALISVLYWKQDDVVQHLIEDMNKDFTGLIEITGSHISPFETFPYISIDLEHVKIYETKEKLDTIVDVEEIFIGFDLWTIISGQMEIKDIKLKEGSLYLTQHENGEFNIVKALEPIEEVEDPAEEFHLDLHEIELVNIDILKINEASNLVIEAFITDADSKFTTSADHVLASLDSRFELNIIKDGDTTFIKHKHFDINTEIDFQKVVDIMTIEPTVIKLEGSEFNLEGSVDFLKDAFVDLHFSGNKKDFSLVMSLAPEELLPVLKRYENSGEIFFDANVKGATLNGAKPKIDAKFGCKNAYFNNQTVNRKLDELNFTGTFTNGIKRDPSTMQVTVSDFHARPEIGEISANLTVTNFNEPEINLQLNSNFELPFLADFLNLKDLEDIQGSIELEMNFHDIIDFAHPEHAISKLNESYYTKLDVKDLSFNSSALPVPINDVDIKAEVNGHKLDITYCNLLFGKSDIKISGSIDDFPAIIHHTDKLVDTRLKIKSDLIDIYELTGSDSAAFDEQITDLRLNLDFKSSARAFTESPNLPIGEFFIENLHAQLKHYPHEFHDFHADLIIEKDNFRLVDFKGMVDDTDFLFSGKLQHYDMWFMEHPKGDTKIDFNLSSKLIRLEDVFSYKGANYVPEDYRHEEFQGLKIHGTSQLHYDDGFKSVDTQLDKFTTHMKIHPLKFEDFKGRIHYENDHLMVEEFSGKLGKSDFKTTLHWYLGKNESVKKRDNHFNITSKRLDLDEIFNYNPPPAIAAMGAPKVDHDAGFNIYDLPFTDMTYHLDIGHMNFHRYLMHKIRGEVSTTSDHLLIIDQLYCTAAGGDWDIRGFFDGSDPTHIHFSPELTVTKIDLEKLLFKFENFGQEYLVSDNLKGEFSGNITGNLLLHTDMMPKIDESEIHADVHVINGELKHFAMLDMMSDYFKDKNLSSVRFDTLDNHLDLTNGILTIPNMTVNSSLGFMDISGKQKTNMDFEYYIRVPWKLVTQAASSKLFKKKPAEVDPEQVDAIQYGKTGKRIRYINLKIEGNPDVYKFSLGKSTKEKN